MFNLSSVLTEIPDSPNSVRRPFLTPIPGEPGNFLMVVDNTSLDHIKRCHKNAYHYLVLGREAHARNAALTFGGALHEGLERFHAWQFFHEDKGQPLEVYKLNQEASIKEQDKAILDYFALNPIPPDILAYDHRTPAAALEVMRHYRQQSNVEIHPDYELEILADADGPIIERSFELPMAVLEVNMKIRGWHNEMRSYDDQGEYTYVSRIHLAWSGRIDLLARCNGQPRVLDHKTSSIDTPDYFRGFELSSQVRGYVWAAQQLWPELGINSFCHNGIFFKPQSKGLKADPARSLIERGPKGGEPRLKFNRTYYPTTGGTYSPEDISRWRRDTIFLIEDFLHSVSRGVYPMNDANCVVKYGLCPYHEVCCMQNEQVGMNLLMSHQYKTVTWNPTHK